MFLPDPAACGAVFPSVMSPAPRIRPARLDAAERAVVLLARADAARFGWEGTPPASPVSAAIRRLFVALTGIEAVQPLADRRLERLRLFGCMMRRGDARAGETAARLLADGFSETALREAVRLALA